METKTRALGAEKADTTGSVMMAVRAVINNIGSGAAGADVGRDDDGNFIVLCFCVSMICLVRSFALTNNATL